MLVILCLYFLFSSSFPWPHTSLIYFLNDYILQDMYLYIKMDCGNLVWGMC